MKEGIDELDSELSKLNIGDAGDYAVSFISRFSKPIGVIYLVFVILLLLAFIFSSTLSEIFSIVWDKFCGKSRAEKAEEERQEMLANYLVSYSEDFIGDLKLKPLLDLLTRS